MIQNANKSPEAVQKKIPNSNKIAILLTGYPEKTVGSKSWLIIGLNHFT